MHTRRCTSMHLGLVMSGRYSHRRTYNILAHRHPRAAQTTKAPDTLTIQCAKIKSATLQSYRYFLAKVCELVLFEMKQLGLSLCLFLETLQLLL